MGERASSWKGRQAAFCLQLSHQEKGQHHFRTSPGVCLKIVLIVQSAKKTRKMLSFTVTNQLINAFQRPVFLKRTRTSHRREHS